MAKTNYQIGLKEMAQVIDISKDYLDWTGFVPVSAELLEKIISCHEGFLDRVTKIEEIMEKRVERVSREYEKEIEKLASKHTRICGVIKSDAGVSCEFDMVHHFDLYRGLEGELERGELEMHSSRFSSIPGEKLVKCARLKATRITCTKGRWYDFKMVEASRNSDGFDMTLFAPTPRHSKNYKMLKQHEELEGAVRILCI